MSTVMLLPMAARMNASPTQTENLQEDEDVDLRSLAAPTTIDPALKAGYPRRMNLTITSMMRLGAVVVGKGKLGLEPLSYVCPMAISTKTPQHPPVG